MRPLNKYFSVMMVMCCLISPIAYGEEAADTVTPQSVETVETDAPETAVAEPEVEPSAPVIEPSAPVNDPSGSSEQSIASNDQPSEAQLATSATEEPVAPAEQIAVGEEQPAADIAESVAEKQASTVPEEVAAEPVEVAEMTAQLEEEEASALSVEELKKKVIELNRDLFILEEDLLFPANTQFVVFLSIDTGKFLDLDVTKLKVNDEIVASHLYTERQLKALSRGGMQRLYVGNLKTGEHEVTAFVEGIGPDDRVYKKAASAMIIKDTEVKAIEIRIADKSQDFQPHISIEEW